MVKQALTTILISIIALAAASCGGGKKDHATVYHACKTVSDRLETDRQFKAKLAEIEKRITL